MKAWIVKAGEPIPHSGRQSRLARSGNIAVTLAKRGHEVVWWASTFEHGAKRHVLRDGQRVIVREGLEVRGIYAPGYVRHRSARRLLHHWWLGRKFRRAIEGESAPDLILAALPLPELAAMCIEFGDRAGVPVVLDCRDMWPDIFLEQVPTVLRWAMRIVLAPMESQTRQACSQAAAIIGHTPFFVDWGLAKGERTRSWRDRDFPLAYSVQPVERAAFKSATRWWAERGVDRQGSDFIAVFVGTLTRHFELDVIAKAVQDIRARGERIQIVICGAGDNEGPLRSVLGDDGRLILAGWVDAPRIAALLELADVGLAPYQSSPSFVASMPNKAVEYLSAGLPIVTSLRGVLTELIDVHGCGEHYPNNSPEALVEILRRLAKTPQRVLTMQAAARNLYAAQFESTAVYDSICEHLENIAADSKLS